jgi:hypothetical protein
MVYQGKGEQKIAIFSLPSDFGMSLILLVKNHRQGTLHSYPRSGSHY